MRRNLLVALASVLLLAAMAWGQGGDRRPIFNGLPVWVLDPSDNFVKVGDLANHAIKVNVVAGSAGGPSGTIGATFPSTVAPAGARDAGGFLASFTVTNAGRLNVTCDNCSSSAATFAQAFPATGGAIGFKDGGGMMASATVDNAGNIFVIASQSSSSWTVNATGTITAHQGDTWTVGLSAGTSVNAVQSGAFTVTPVNTFASNFPSVGVAAGFRDGAGRMASASVDNAFNLFVIASQGQANSGQAWTVNLSQVNGTTIVTGGTAGLVGVGGPTATGSQASGNPVRMGAIGQTTGRTVTDGNVGDLSLTTTSDLRVRADTSGATATLAPSRVQIVGGWGTNATATQVTICDQYASVSITSSGNTQIITGVAGQQVRICTVNLIIASATAVGFFEGAGTLCNTNRTGIFGGAATGNGLNISSNGGQWGSGFGEIARTQVTGNNVCIGNSTSAIISGGIMWTRF